MNNPIERRVERLSSVVPEIEVPTRQRYEFEVASRIVAPRLARLRRSNHILTACQAEHREPDWSQFRDVVHVHQQIRTQAIEYLAPPILVEARNLVSTTGTP